MIACRGNSGTLAPGSGKAVLLHVGAVVRLCLERYLFSGRVSPQGATQIMPITILKAPTAAEVEETIRTLECEFKMRSDKFESSSQAYASVPDAAAAEWAYVLEQRRVLQGRSCKERYWKTTSGSRTRNEREAERADYAASVAA
jgi:hypothetical protein